MTHEQERTMSSTNKKGPCLLQTRKDHVFYKQINKHKGRLRQCITELTVNESVCTTEDEILNGWREHFLKLATPVDDCEYDNIYRRQTEEDLNNIIAICEHQSYSINISGCNLQLEKK